MKLKKVNQTGASPALVPGRIPVRDNKGAIALYGWLRRFLYLALKKDMRLPWQKG
jgi:hypothetical protein